MSSLSETLLFLAARSDLVQKQIKPNLKKDFYVISDRFLDSTLAYQGYGRKLDMQLIKELESISTQGLHPDITFLLDIPIDERNSEE